MSSKKTHALTKASAKPASKTVSKREALADTEEIMSFTAGDRKGMAMGSAVKKRLSYDSHRNVDHPREPRKIFRRAKLYNQESDFVRMFLPIKRAIYNYGLTFIAVDEKNGTPGKKEDQDKLDAWLNSPSEIKHDDYTDPLTNEIVEIENQFTNLEMILKLVEEVWDDFLLLDNAICLWLDEQGFAITLPIEACDFQDKFNIPILRYYHTLTPREILLLPADQQERFKRAVLLVNPKFGEHFKVLKRAKTGEGFGLPNIYSIFRLLGEVESKQIGMNQMAFLMRNVTRMHKLGHEIKNGDRAGKPLHFWKAERGAKVKGLWENIVGINEVTANFDETIEYPWPDLKVFDTLAFKGSSERLMNWAGPVAQMLFAKGVMPYITPLLRSQATDDRAKFGNFMASVIFKAYKPPTGIRLEFSDLIFNETKLMSELIKFASMNGLMSTQTGREWIGLNDARERGRKREEAKDTDADSNVKPFWDSSHGFAPALGEKIEKAGAGGAPGENGRRPGS